MRFAFTYRVLVVLVAANRDAIALTRGGVAALALQVGQAVVVFIVTTPRSSIISAEVLLDDGSRLSRTTRPSARRASDNAGGGYEKSDKGGNLHFGG